jgi:hypothetical protein
MNPDPSIPSLRDLPPGRLEAHHAHLLSEIGRQSPSRLRPPTVAWTSLRVAAVAGASATAAAAITAAVAVTWGGGAASGHATGPRHPAYAFHDSPARSITYSGLDYLPLAASRVYSTAYGLRRGGRVPLRVYLLAR